MMSLMRFSGKLKGDHLRVFVHVYDHPDVVARLVDLCYPVCLTDLPNITKLVLLLSLS